MNPIQFFRKFPYITTSVLMALAAAMRVWPLYILGPKVAWLTFYPAVMIASVIGGFRTGMFGATLSCLIVYYGWPSLVSEPFINGPSDWLSMVVFYLNCVLISSIAEAMIRAKQVAESEREAANTANKAKSVFLANMSHELRTPLIGILGFSRLLNKSGNLLDSQAAYVDIIIKSGERLLGLINNILDLAKIESGHIALYESAVNLQGLLQDVTSAVSVRAAEKGLNLKFENLTEIPNTAMLDGMRLQQVLTNLLANAIKFTKNGSVTLRASVNNGTNINVNTLRLDVIDTGPGIPETDRERIFLPFVQLAKASSIETGTGLGLSISKQYVQLMNGRISVLPNPDGGSIFSVEIPIKVVDDSSLVTAEAASTMRVTGLAPGQPLRRILIAEDREESRLLISEILRPLGFELREVVNGQEAINTCQSWQPDLIWMDIRMPVLDGKEATKCIRQIKSIKQPKIIALTAHALDEECREIIAAGCDEIVRKPYRETDLLDALSRHLGVIFTYESLHGESPISLLSSNGKSLQTNIFDPCWVAEFISSVEKLDTTECMRLINQANDIPEMARNILIQHVKQYRFGDLLVVFDNRSIGNGER